jgi:acyl carrier protein
MSKYAGGHRHGRRGGTAVETYDAVETYEAVATRIRDYLSRNFLFSENGFEYEDDASFLELGVIDSFGFMELLHWVEEDFAISVADDELVPDNFDSVRKLSAFILAKRSSTA